MHELIHRVKLCTPCNMQLNAPNCLCGKSVSLSGCSIENFWFISHCTIRSRWAWGNATIITWFWLCGSTHWLRKLQCYFMLGSIRAHASTQFHTLISSFALTQFTRHIKIEALNFRCIQFVLSLGRWDCEMQHLMSTRWSRNSKCCNRKWSIE